MRNKYGVYLVAALAACMLSSAYWMLYSVSAYNTFHEYTALDYYAYSMYYDVNYPSVMGGLQLFVFGKHIAPDQLFVLVVYYLWRSPLALLFIQDIVLSFTGLIVFVAASDLLGSPRLGMLFELLFLLNPGMHGILSLDYHAEMLIVPFYILTFYYYARGMHKHFFASLTLLLGTIEAATALVAATAVAFAIYSHYNLKGKDRAEKMHLAKMMVVFALAALLVYNLIYYYLAASYASYSAVPPFLRLEPWPGVPIYGTPIAYSGVSLGGGIYTLLGEIAGGNLGALAQTYLNFTVVYGLLVAVLGFGIGALYELPYLVVMASPWFVEVFLLGFTYFASTGRHYFSFAIGGAFVAAIWGTARLLRMNAGKTRGWLRLRPGAARPLIYSSAITIMTVLFLISLFLYAPEINWSAIQGYTFSPTPAQQRAYTQLESVMNLVPQGAQLMTQDNVMVHMMDRPYIELPWEPSFQPQYILFDLDSNLSVPYYSNETQAFYSYINANGYQLYAQNGSAVLYRLPN